MNNKGFTLIELLATIILLAIIMTVTTVSVVNIMDSSNNKSYSILVEDIKIAAQEYFEECENNNIISTNITCPSITTSDSSSYITKTSNAFKLDELLNYGFLKGTSVEEDNARKILDPKTNANIGTCTLKVTKKITKNTRNVVYTVARVSSSVTVSGKTISCPSY